MVPEATGKVAGWAGTSLCREGLGLWQYCPASSADASPDTQRLSPWHSVGHLSYPWPPPPAEHPPSLFPELSPPLAHITEPQVPVQQVAGS